MNVDEVKRIYDFAIAKNNGQGYNTPDEFNLNIKVAEAGYFDFLRGEYQRYQVQRPIAVVEFGQNQNIRTSLAPLVYGAVLNINSSTGIASYPSDFQLVDAMWGVYGTYNIRFVQQDRANGYVRSKIDPIASNPIYLIQHEGFHFYPETLGQARLSYLRTVPYMVWAYTIDQTTGEPIYDPTNSRQPVWADSDLFQIIVRALQRAGVNLQSGVVMQYANDIKNNGQ